MSKDYQAEKFECRYECFSFG